MTEPGAPSTALVPADVPTDRADIDREIATIHHTIRENRRDYWRDGALRARHRALIEARDGTDRLPGPPGDIEHPADRLANGQALVGAVVHHLGPEGRAFLSSVDALPDAVQAAFIAEAGMPPWKGRARPADGDLLEAVTGAPEFAGLIKAWGGPASDNTARKAGILNARLSRVLDGLSARDRRDALWWWENLPPKDAAMLAWELTGGWN